MSFQEAEEVAVVVAAVADSEVDSVVVVVAAAVDSVVALVAVAVDVVVAEVVVAVAAAELLLLRRAPFKNSRETSLPLMIDFPSDCSHFDDSLAGVESSAQPCLLSFSPLPLNLVT